MPADINDYFKNKRPQKDEKRGESRETPEPNGGGDRRAFPIWFFIVVGTLLLFILFKHSQLSIWRGWHKGDNR